MNVKGALPQTVESVGIAVISQNLEERVAKTVLFAAKM